MISVLDLSLTASEDDLYDVIDITDEDTLLRSPSPPSVPREHNQNNVTGINENTVTSLINSQTQPVVQQEFSATSFTTDKTSPSCKTETDDDVVEISKEIEVIVIEDSTENSSTSPIAPSEDDVIVIEDDDIKTAVSLPLVEKPRSDFTHSGTAFSFPAEPSLLTPPSTPSCLRDLKDLNAFKTESQEIGLSLKSQYTLSTEHDVMVVIPSPELDEKQEKRQDENLDDKINSLHGENMKSRIEFEPSPTHFIDEEEELWSWDDSPLADNTTSNLKKSPPRSTEDALQSLQSLSEMDTDHNSSTSKLSSTPTTEDNPLEGPSSLLDDDTRSTLILSPTDCSQETAPSSIIAHKNAPSILEFPSTHLANEMSRNVQSPDTISKSRDFYPNLMLTSTHSNVEVLPNSKLLSTFSTNVTSPNTNNSHLTDHASSSNDASTAMSVSPLHSEDVSRTPVLAVFPTLSTEESIFDCPIMYQLYYKKCSPETRDHLDKICHLREKIITTLNKYSNNDSTEPKTDKTTNTKNVKNNETAVVNYQNNKVNDNIEKSTEASLGNLRKTQKITTVQKTNKIINKPSMAKITKHLKKIGTEMCVTQNFQNEPVKNYDHNSIGNDRKIANRNDILSKMPHHSALSIILEKSCIDTTHKEEKREKIEPQVTISEINLGHSNSQHNESQQDTKKSKRKSGSVARPNQNMSYDIKINDNSPRCKKLKLLHHPSEISADSEQRNTKPNINRKDDVFNQKKFTKSNNSLKPNEKKNATIINQNQKPPKSNKKTKTIKRYVTDSNNFIQNDDRKLAKLNQPSISSNRLPRNFEKETSSKTASDSVKNDPNTNPVNNIVSQTNNSQSQLEITFNIGCPVHCSGNLHSRREPNPLSIPNQMPYQAYQCCCTTHKNLPFYNLQKLEPIPNFQRHLLQTPINNYLKTVAELPHIRLPNYSSNKFVAQRNEPPYSIDELVAAIDVHSNMMHPSMAEIIGYPRGTSFPVHNILQAPTIDQRDGYMTINGGVARISSPES